MNLSHSVKTVTEVARAAGAILRQGYGQPKHIQRKQDAVDWVTQYDTAAEGVILAGLRAAFPDHAIVAEESSPYGTPGGLTWYVDPLDGTTNFAHDFPVFCVSIGLLQGPAPLLAVIYDPLRDECFTATRGGGAFCHGRGGTRPMQVSTTSSLADALLATGFPYDRHTSPVDNVAQTAAFLKRAHGVRRAGSAALDLAYVAAGRLDGYWEFKLKPWDVAAATLLVTEAGGRVTGMDGAPFAPAPSLDLVVSNGRLHQAMMDVLVTVARPAPSL